MGIRTKDNMLRTPWGHMWNLYLALDENRRHCPYSLKGYNYGLVLTMHPKHKPQKLTQKLARVAQARFDDPDIKAWTESHINERGYKLVDACFAFKHKETYDLFKEWVKETDEQNAACDLAY